MNWTPSKSWKKTLAFCTLFSMPVIHSTEAIALAITPAQQKEQFREILTSVLPTAEGIDFNVELVGGQKDNLKIGSLVAYEFSSSEDCHVTLINIDSQGAVSLLTPWAGERLRAGTTRQYPESGSFDVLEVQAPTGVDTMAAFCSSVVTQTMDTIAKQDIVTEGHDASRLLAALVGSLVENDVQFNRQIWQQRVIGRSASEQYSDTDVVSFFTMKTRSLKSRKLPLEINFQYNSAKLTSQARSTLDMIGKALTSSKLARNDFRLGGHTDSTGPDVYNLALSKARAAATQRYLVSKFNIDPVRLEVQPYGEHLPKADNNNSTGRAENRRVELEQLD